MVRDWEDVQILWESNGGGGWNWDVVALLKRQLPDGPTEYAVYSDGGCSCRCAYEDSPDSYDFAWVQDPQSLADELRREISGQDLDAADKATAKAEVTMVLRAERYL